MTPFCSTTPENDLVPCYIQIRHRDSLYDNIKSVSNSDQIHVVKQGTLSVYVDNNSHKLKRPKKFTSRWCVLTRCEKTGQHTLHVCKSDNPDSSVKDSYPVQTSWSIKSAYCLKPAQRMEIFKEEGFLIHMGRQIMYISCTSRSEVKSWICAILEGVTLGFEYHCVPVEPNNLGVVGDCMLVISPECLALVCPLTGAPLRKWPYFILNGCGVTDSLLWWTIPESRISYRVKVNEHNVFTLYNVITRYLAHTNPAVQVTIQISSTEQFKSKSSERAPAENKYTTRATLTASGTKMNNSHGLRNNLLYESQDKCGNGGNNYRDSAYEQMGSSHSDYSTGYSSTTSTYESDVYEFMENCDPKQDCIYEDMSYSSNTSPLTDDGYRTSSTSLHLHSRHPPQAVHRSSPDKTPSVYMNMNKIAKGTSAPYEYIDIRYDESPSPPADEPPALPPFRNQTLVDSAVNIPYPDSPHSSLSRQSCATVTSSSSTITSMNHVTVPTIPRDKLRRGLKHFQEQTKLENEMILSFSATVLEGNSEQPLFKNSAV